MAKSLGLTDILNKIHREVRADETLAVSDVMEAFENRGFGPLLLAASLLTVLPTGGIPMVPTFTGIVIIFIAGQILMGRKTPWLPSFLREREIDKTTFEKARLKAKPWTRKIDIVLKPRLEKITSEKGLKLIAALCIAMALSMPFLEILPFAAMIPACAIAVMSVGLTARDGYAMILGLAISAFALWNIYYWLF